MMMCFFFSSRRRHTRWTGDWSSDVCSSDLGARALGPAFGRSWAAAAHRPADDARPAWLRGDRKSVVKGKSVDLGGRRIIKKKKNRRAKTEAPTRRRSLLSAE